MKIVKRIGLVLIFILAFTILYLYLAMLVMPKDIDDMGGEKYYNYLNFENEQKNSLDILFFGDSSAYYDISPMQIFSNSGNRTYVCAGAHESAKTMENNLKRTLKRQKPQLVVFETDFLFCKNRTYTGSTKQKLQPLVAPFTLHARWKELTLKDFYKFPTKFNDVYKGYILSTDVYPFTADPSYYDYSSTDTVKIDSNIIKSLKRMIKLCKNNNAEVMFTYMPIYSWNIKRHNSIINLQDELLKQGYNISFLDLNMPNENFNFDFNKHFKDAGSHANIQGATIITNYLSNYISTNYNITSTLNEKVNLHWQQDLENYKQRVSKYGISV